MIEEIALDDAPSLTLTDQPTRLNIGCGRDIKPGYINLDRVSGPGVDVVTELEALAVHPLPFEDNSIDQFVMSHVIEHIENVLPMMEELYRVAKPDAEMVIRCPHGASDDADEDPTHVRRMFHGSFLAFAQPYYWRADYGYRGDWSTENVQMIVPRKSAKSSNSKLIFEKIRHRRNMVVEMVATLHAVKPARAQDYSLMKTCEVGINLVDA